MATNLVILEEKNKENNNIIHSHDIKIKSIMEEKFEIETALEQELELKMNLANNSQ